MHWSRQLGRRHVEPRLLLLVLPLLAGTGFVALVIWPLSGRSRDYDEGVYWQSLRALAHGHRLFESVFASQPPAFYYGILPFYVAFDRSIEGARIGILAFALLGLVATYLSGRILAGPLGGLVALILLAADPLYVHEAQTLQAEMPALALGLASLAIVLGVNGVGRARLPLVGVAGLLLGFGVGVKLFDLVLSVPIMCALLALPGISDRVRRAAYFLAGGLLSGVIMAVPYADQLQHAWEDLVRLHIAAGQALPGGIAYNLHVVLMRHELPFEALAALLIVVTIARRDPRIVVPLLWVASAFAALLLYRPLIGHQVVLLAPGLALAATAAIVALPEGNRRPIAVALVALVASIGLSLSVRSTAAVARAGPHEVLLASTLATVTQPADLVITDNQFVAAMADRDVPPSLVDTSAVRIRSGSLTSRDVEQVAENERVHAILFDTGRLELLVGYRTWVSSRFQLVRSFGNGSELDIRP